MRLNPQSDWRIEQLKALAGKAGVDWRAPGGSHVTFRFASGVILTVPAARPIKAVYIRQFVKYLDEHGF